MKSLLMNRAGLSRGRCWRTQAAAMADTAPLAGAPPPNKPAHGHLLAHLPQAGAEEEFLPLVTHGATRIERIVSTGQSSPPGFWYDQDEDEFVLLVTGGARLAIEGQGEALMLAPGDWVHLPAHCRHRVEWTCAEPPTVWLAVFSSAGEQ